MIEKLELKSFKGKYAKAHEAIFTNQLEIHLKINEIIDVVNRREKAILMLASNMGDDIQNEAAKILYL